MQAVHKTLLEVNEEFLVSEAPAEPLLAALQGKRVLTDLDLQQLRSLEAQGPRALKRFVLHVLPLRGPRAFLAFLEALQEAQARHLVDLLLEEEAVLRDAVQPIELPPLPASRPPLEDPHEYARKLRINLTQIEDAVQPQDVVPGLLHANVLSPLEQSLLREVEGQPALTWSVLWAVLMQRGPRAYQAFLEALLQHGHADLHRAIVETKVTGVEALLSTLTRNMESSSITTTSHPHPSVAARRPTAATPSTTHPPDEAGGPGPRSSQHSRVAADRGSEVKTAPSVPGTAASTSHTAPVSSMAGRRSSEGDLATATVLSPVSTALSALPLKTAKPRSAGFTDFPLRPTTAVSGGLLSTSPVQPQFITRSRQRGFGVLTSGSSRSVAASRRLTTRHRHLQPIQYSLGTIEFRPRSRDLIQTRDGLRSATASSSSRCGGRGPEDALYSPTWSDPDHLHHLRRLDTDTPHLSLGRFTPLPPLFPSPQDTAAAFTPASSQGPEPHSKGETDSADPQPQGQDTDAGPDTPARNPAGGKGDRERANASPRHGHTELVSANGETLPDTKQPASPTPAQSLSDLAASDETREEDGRDLLTEQDPEVSNDRPEKVSTSSKPPVSQPKAGHRRRSLASLGPEEVFNMDAIPELEDEREWKSTAAAGNGN